MSKVEKEPKLNALSEGTQRRMWLNEQGARLNVMRRECGNEPDAVYEQRIVSALVHIPGSFGAINAAVEVAIYEAIPLYADVEVVKRKLAFHWLERDPRGFWRRLFWALRLTWRKT